MACNILVSSEEKLLPKSVQELSMDGDEPPSEYIVKEKYFGSKVSSTPIPIPIIDVTLLRRATEAKAIGHGMSNAYLDKVREVAKQFFALPEEEKQKYASALNESEGYGYNGVVSEKQVLDWCYRLSLRVFPKEQRRLSLWPQNPTDLSEILEEFSSRVKSVMDYLLKSMARSLNLEEGSFLDQFGKQSSLQARLNFYPRCSRPELVHGVKPHTDRSGITVLLQDKEVEGLQVLIDDKWVNVLPIPDALVVNLGDHMEIMSNGIFKSIMHRVVTNTEKMRMSIALFNEPEPENEIGPAEGLITEAQPRMYRNVKNFGDIIYKCYQEGKIALDTVKIAYDNDQK